MNPANWDTVKYLEKVHVGKIMGTNRILTKVGTKRKHKIGPIKNQMDFPGGLDGKEPACQRRRH